MLSKRALDGFALGFFDASQNLLVAFGAAKGGGAAAVIVNLAARIEAVFGFEAEGAAWPFGHLFAAAVSCTAAV